jgi:hypothetical protein
MTRTLPGRRVLFLLFVAACLLRAQESDDLLPKIRGLSLAEKPGVIPLLYALSTESRAIAYQKSLTAAHAWFEEQLHVRVPVRFLAVLDQEASRKLSPGEPYPFLPSNPDEGVLMNGDLDKLPALHATPLPGEVILFHETGHIFAHSLKIGGPGWEREFFANVFSAAYILAKRPDLQVVLAGAPAEKWPSPPRYTSLSDLKYLYSEVGSANYVWFQNELERLAGLFVKERSLAEIVRKLQKAFPAGSTMTSSESFIPDREIYARLDGIRPGFRKMLGALGAPTTLPRVRPSPCPAVPKKVGLLIVENRMAHPVTVIGFEGGPAREIPGHSWSQFVGTVKIPDGSCLMPRDEPGLAVLDRVAERRQDRAQHSND